MRLNLDADDIAAVCAMDRDGETHTVAYEDGTEVTFTLDVTYDDVDVCHLWCDESMGELGEPRRNACTGREYRPDGFDGAARKLYVGRSYDAWWWQPPAELKGDREAIDMLADYVKAILEWGWQLVTLEMTVRDETGAESTYSGTIGGVEPTDDGMHHAISDYLLDMVTTERENEEEDERDNVLAAMAAATGFFAMAGGN